MNPVGGSDRGGLDVAVEISYFSLICLLALAVFLAIMVPRSLFHLGHVVISRLARRPAPVDGWLLGIAASMLVCAALALAAALDNNRAQDMLNRSAAPLLSLLFFALPAVFQVVRAWANRHAKTARTMSPVLVALAIVSLPASMAVATAALLQSAATPTATPDSPAAALADDRYFTDSELANDPADFPIATYLERNFTLAYTVPPNLRLRGLRIYRQIPAFTAFWIDQTTDVLSFEASDCFGLLISPITFVRDEWAIEAAVFLYKLLCALVLVAVSFDTILAPLFARARALSPRRARGRETPRGG
jgi:hypothetical protein